MPDGDYLRDDSYYENCWGGTSSAKQDNALEPRLEFQEWDAPPSTKTAWHVSYKQPQLLPDGSTRLRWSGFVAGGVAIVGADGLMRSVRIDDHGQARGRTEWSSVQVNFTGFPRRSRRCSLNRAAILSVDLRVRVSRFGRRTRR